MNVYVFPTESQVATQQSKDEADCYNWAVQNTGNDPFSLMKQADQQAFDQFFLTNNCFCRLASEQPGH